MAKLNIYLGLQNGFIKKIVCASSIAEAKKALTGLDAVRVASNSYYYITAVSGRSASEFSYGRVCAILSVVGSGSINALKVSDTHIVFGSRVLNSQNFYFDTSGTNNTRLLSWIPINSDLENDFKLVRSLKK